MKSAIVLAVSAVGVVAQTPPKIVIDPKTCTNDTAPKNLDPMVQFTPGSVKWPCNTGKGSVPFGKVPAGCAKFEVLVARGTGEPGQFGTIIGDPLIARVIRVMAGKDVRGYPVQYPADLSVVAQPGEDPKAAEARRDVGPKDVVNRIASQMKECPDERFALVGYSQGGGVISRAAALLTPQQIEKIDAVVSYGAKGTFPASLEKKWLNNCAPGDQCGGLPGNEGHLSYNDKGTIWHDRSAKYIADAFSGKSQGQIFAKTSRN